MGAYFDLSVSLKQRECPTAVKYFWVQLYTCTPINQSFNQSVSLISQPVFNVSTWSKNNLKCPYNRNANLVSQQCTPSEFTCDDGSCIDLRLVDNGVDDCADGSDEPFPTTVAPSLTNQSSGTLPPYFRSREPLSVLVPGETCVLHSFPLMCWCRGFTIVSVSKFIRDLLFVSID